MPLPKPGDLTTEQQCQMIAEASGWRARALTAEGKLRAIGIVTPEAALSSVEPVATPDVERLREAFEKSKSFVRVAVSVAGASPFYNEGERGAVRHMGETISNAIDGEIRALGSKSVEPREGMREAGFAAGIEAAAKLIETTDMYRGEHGAVAHTSALFRRAAANAIRALQPAPAPSPAPSSDAMREALERLTTALAKVMPITTNDTPDYAEVTFGDHQTQAMTMAPNDWLAIAEAYEAGLAALTPDPDALTGCADDQTFAAVPVETVRLAAEEIAHVSI